MADIRTDPSNRPMPCSFYIDIPLGYTKVKLAMARRYGWGITVTTATKTLSINDDAIFNVDAETDIYISASATCRDFATMIVDCYLYKE